MSNSTNFFDRDDVKVKVEQLWAAVFESSSKVLEQHTKFGFDGVAMAKDPSLADRVTNLQILGAVIDVLLKPNSTVGDLEYEQQRQLLNARAQITTMEQLAAAMQVKNEADYLRAVEALDLSLIHI